MLRTTSRQVAVAAASVMATLSLTATPASAP